MKAQNLFILFNFDVVELPMTIFTPKNDDGRCNGHLMREFDKNIKKIFFKFFKRLPKTTLEKVVTRLGSLVGEVIF